MILVDTSLYLVNTLQYSHMPLMEGLIPESYIHPIKKWILSNSNWVGFFRFFVERENLSPHLVKKKMQSVLVTMFSKRMENDFLLQRDR